LSAAASAALSKVRGVLPAGLRESIDEAILTVPDIAQRGTAQRGSARVAAPAGAALVDAVSMDAVSVDPAVLREAIRAEHKLKIAYRDNAGQASERSVWPFLIGDFRGFRVDRIASAEDTGQHYPRKRTALVREWRKSRDIVATDRN
jgi:predicted DNA-binding transcriptional regulator YafY